MSPWLIRPLRFLACPGLVIAMLAGGCSRGRVSESPDGPTAEELVAFYTPRGIKILPFTKPRSFDDDLIPDGVEVSLRTLDGAGDSVKAYGVFNFELYEFREAAGNHHGERIHFWEQAVLGIEDQKQFWERVTTTYQFQLSWAGRPLSPQRKYVLDVSFQAPGGQRLFDSYVMEFRIDRQEMMDSLSTAGAAGE